MSKKAITKKAITLSGFASKADIFENIEFLNGFSSRNYCAHEFCSSESRKEKLCLEKICSSYKPDLIIAWSTGAMILAEFLANSSIQSIGGIEKVVLISASASFVSRDSWPTLVSSSELRAMKLGIRRDRAETVKSFFLRAASELSSTKISEITQRFLTGSSSFSDEELVSSLEFLERYDISERLSFSSAALLDIPVLVLAGSLDKVVSSASSKSFANSLPNSSYVEYPDGSHLLISEHSKWVSEQIENFCGLS